MKPTLHISRGKGSSDAETALFNYRVQQSSCTRAVYSFAKKNNETPSCEEAINSESEYQTLINSRNNLVDMNYWLKQAAIKRACQSIKQDEERRQKDDAEYERLLKKKDRLEKKLQKLKASHTKSVDKLKSLYIELGEAPSELKRQKTSKKIKTAEAKMSKKSEPSKIAFVKKELTKTSNKIKKIEERRKRNYVSIFGTRDSFLERCKKNITHEEFVAKRLMPLYSVGDKEHGNRLFELREDGIVMKITKEEHHFFPFYHITKSQRKTLDKIIKAVNDGLMGFSITIDDDFINITYDNAVITKDKSEKYTSVLNRIYAFDGNPETCGCACLDWRSSGRYKILKTDTYSFSDLFNAWFELKKLEDVPSNDPRRIHIHNQIEHWTPEVAKAMVADAKHLHAEVFVAEKLVIESSDLGHGKDCNTKCNNLWHRQLLYNCIKRQCETEGIYYLEIAPEYSSFEGNLLFRKHINEPDMNLAAMELSRRGFEYYTQHVAQRRAINTRKNIVFADPHLFQKSLAVSEEEIGIDIRRSCDWKKQFCRISKTGTMYRRYLPDTSGRFSKLRS